MDNEMIALGKMVDTVLKYRRIPTEVKPTFEQRRTDFLESLSRGSKLKYKRSLGSPLRYAGGKSLAVGLIVEKLGNYILDSQIKNTVGGGEND